MMSVKPVSSFTIRGALTTKVITYKNYKGIEVVVPSNTYIYVDVAANVALVGKDHIDIGEDEYRCVSN
jgi:hypothetical protein